MMATLARILYPAFIAKPNTTSERVMPPMERKRNFFFPTRSIKNRGGKVIRALTSVIPRDKYDATLGRVAERMLVL